MFGVAVTNNGEVVVNLNGIQCILDPQAAEDLCGLIYHALEIISGEEEPTKETLQ